MVACHQDGNEDRGVYREGMGCTRGGGRSQGVDRENAPLVTGPSGQLEGRDPLGGQIGSILRPLGGFNNDFNSFMSAHKGRVQILLCRFCP